jgi:protease-4
VAQGRVWTGRQASELGLVDELGGLDRAIAIAKERARIDADTSVSLVVYPPRRTLYDIVANPLDLTMAARVGMVLGRPEARVVDAVASVLGRFRSGEPLAIMPNVFWR